MRNPYELEITRKYDKCIGSTLLLKTEPANHINAHPAVNQPAADHPNKRRIEEFIFVKKWKRVKFQIK